VKLAPQDVAVLERHSTMNHEAYDTFLRARDFLFRLTKTNVQLAIRLYRKAIDLDPKFARAHAGLAEAFAVLYQLFERNEEYLDRASENAMKAIVFDPGVSEAYSALGLVYYNKGLLDEAHEAARRAVDLDPENILGYHDLAHVHITRDNLEGAAAALERILVLNPSFYAAFAHLRQVYERLGRAADASILSEREIAFYPVYLARHPDDARAHISFAVALAFAGQHEEARTECDSALELTPDDPLMLYNAACVYSRIGAPESALSVLAGAVAAGHAEYEWIKRDPDLDNIREHAGYIELMKGH
jgi:tetratricopeptide (TPR) repeat protein